MLAIDYNEFLSELNSGREIEILFRGEWYFFSSRRKKKALNYIFYAMNQPIESECAYSELQELCNIEIQGCALKKVLAQLQDYIIY